jgi:hypothetical protein
MVQDAAPGVAKEAAGALFGGMKDQALMEQTQPQT